MKAELLKLRFSRLPLLVGVVLVVEAVITSNLIAWFQAVVRMLISLNDTVPNATDADKMSVESLNRFALDTVQVQTSVIDLSGAGSFGGSIAGLGMFLLGALAVIGEYRSGTIARTVLHVSRRVDVVVHKVQATLVVAGLLALLLAVIRATSLYVALAANGVALVVAPMEVALILVRGVLVLLLCAAAGVGAGFLVRNPTPLILGAFGLLIIESTLRSLSLLTGSGEEIVQALPFALVGSAVRESGGVLTPTFALLLLLCWTAVVLVGASASLRRRELGFGPGA